MGCTNEKEEPQKRSFFETIMWGNRWSEQRKEEVRKLTLWHSRTFEPIHTHQELEPIMASIGFAPLIPTFTGTKSVQWREYVFRSMHLITGSGLDPKSKPRLRLPYPRVDGLHFKSYQAFLAALECYINPYVVANLFHIRRVYRLIRDLTFEPELKGVVLYFYRGSTLDYTAEKMCGRFSCTETAETAEKYVRKDERRQIEEDERDDSSDFVCLVDELDASNGDGESEALSRGECLVGVSGELRGDGKRNFVKVKIR